LRYCFTVPVGRDEFPQLVKYSRLRLQTYIDLFERRDNLGEGLQGFFSI
jgi:hypothetical protein